MGYARHIGRVGALAVALGIGAAAATTSAVANAEPDSGSVSSSSPSADDGPSSTSSSSSTATAPSAAETSSAQSAAPGDSAVSNVPDNDEPSRPGLSAHIADEDDDDLDALLEAAEEKEGDTAPSIDDDEGSPHGADHDAPEMSLPSADSGSEPSSSVRADRHELPEHRNGGADVSADLPTADYEVAPVVSMRSHSVEGGRVAAAVTTLADPSPPSRLTISAVAVKPTATTKAAQLHPPVAVPTTVVSLVTTLASTLLAPFLSTSPMTPTQPTMLWAVLACARREFGRTFFNRRPYAVDDNVVTSEDTATTIAVLGNDTDPDDKLKIIGYTQPGHGDVVLNPDGTFTYTPDPEYNGPDTFGYTVKENTRNWHLHGLRDLFTEGGHTDSATVRVTVAAVDDAPVAVDDTATIAEDSPAVTINVLGNDTDIDGGGPIEVIAVHPPAATTGTVLFSHQGVTYTPAQNFNGEAVFGYTLAGGSTATVTVTVNPVDDAATAVGDTATTAEDRPVTIDVLGNDTDIDGGPKKVIGVELPTTTGTVDFSETTVTYTPPANFSGVDTFAYVLDGGSTTTVTVTVNPVNDAPAAVGDGFSSAVDAATGTVTGTVDAEDVDDDALAYTLATAPTKGRVTVDPDTGAFTYIPTQASRLLAAVSAANRTDSFTVTVADGNGASINVPVTVAISPTAITRTDATTVSRQEGTAVDGLAVSPTGDRVYVLHESLQVIDTTTDPNTFRATIPRSGIGIVVIDTPGGDTRAFFTDGGVWVFNTASGAFIDANPATTGTTDPIAVAGGPKALAASPDRTRLYVTQVDAASVSVIDTADNRVIATITDGVGARPWAVAVGTTPLGTRAYVVNEGSNSVSVIDTATNTKVVNPIAVGNTPREVAISPDGTRVYVANSNGGGVSVIDTTSNTVIASIPVPGSRAGSLAVSPDGSTLFVMSGTTGFAVFDTATNALITTVPAAFSLFNYLQLSGDSRIYASSYVNGEFDVMPVLLEFTIAPTAGPAM